MKMFSRLLVVFIMISSFGCASKYMKPAGPDAEASYKPAVSESAVIFMRPSFFGGAIQSAVYDVTSEEEDFVGIVSAKTKIAYKTTPGEHTFMVIGESADFMKADLEGGKTYFALVTPRIGAWKARFSLKPIHKNDLESDQFGNWQNSCNFVENTDDSYQWAQDHSANIKSMREEYYRKWLEKPEQNRPLLSREDGI